MSEEKSDAPNDLSPVTPDQMAERLQKMMQDIVSKAFESGYQRGWRDACAAAAKAIEPLATATVHPDETIDVQVTVNVGGMQPRASAAEPSRRGAIPEIVLDMVRERPGLTGVQLVGYAKERGTPLHERSIRTALRRLRIAKRIINREGGWHPSGRQPPGLQREISNASDRVADVPAVEDE